jgi:hypothetical protein
MYSIQGLFDQMQTHPSTPGYTSYIIEYHHIKVQHPSVTTFDPNGVTLQNDTAY